MAKLNWNRPNGGYEKEPWDKSWDKTKTKSKSTLADYPLHNHADHPATVKIKQYGNNKSVPVLWCVKCNKHITTLRWDDYNAIKGKL
jgi:hypothetical protein